MAPGACAALGVSALAVAYGAGGAATSAGAAVAPATTRAVPAGAVPARAVPAHSASARRASVKIPTLSDLAGLRNYAFTYSAAYGASATVTSTGRVHSPTDWQLTVHTGHLETTTYDVDGHGYSVVSGFPGVQHVSFNSPEGLTHLNGEHTWAEGFIGYTHVLGMRISTAGNCRVAGDQGTVYDFKTPEADKSVFAVADRACVARSHGALLSFAEGVTGGSAAAGVGLTGKSQQFAVTAIGNVGSIAAPKARATKATTPTPSAPTTPSVSSHGLPSGFPSQVPAPPGKIMSSTRIGSDEWYLELSEANASAIADYESTLHGKGFTLTRRSDTAAGDIDLLSDPPLQAELEQISLPGQGVVLTVIVKRS